MPEGIQTEHAKLREGAPRFALVVCALWAIATVPRLLTHELWRDEVWVWLVVLDANSIGELFQSLAPVGQGYLFAVLCFIGRQFTESPRAMQFVQLLAASAGVYIFARWAPLGRFERVLVLAGYFAFYEYAVISRHYAIGTCLVWLACVMIRNRPSIVGLGLAFALLCQTNVHAFILAIALGCGWFLDRLIRRDALPPIAVRERVLGGVIAILGAIAGIAQLMPTAGSRFDQAWKLSWNAALALRVTRQPWRAFVPVPTLRVQFWNTNLLDPWPIVQALAGVAILLLAIALLAKRPVALVTFSTSAIGTLVFAYTKFPGEMRHCGHLWIAFVAAIWIGGGLDPDGIRRTWRTNVLAILLVLQCVAAGFASWIDIRHPFTNGPATAELLRDEGLDQLPLLGHREPPASSVAFALGKPLYAPSRGVYAKYPDYGPKEREMGDRELRCIARAFARAEKSDIVLVLNRKLTPWGELEPAGACVGAIQPSEDYHLYRLRLDRLDRTDGDAACPDVIR